LQELLREHRIHGLCSFYIARHRRFCRKHSGVGLHCTDHLPSNLSEIRERTFHQQANKHLTIDVPRQRRTRISSSQKRMMNPLNVFHSDALLGWAEDFDHSKELFIDVGCARGTLLQRLASTYPSFNYCGLEIRPELVGAGNEKAISLNLQSRLRFLSCSANVSFRTMFGRSGYCDSLNCWSYKSCPLHHHKIRLVSVLFPDPWKRGKHQRRRVMNTQFVDQLAECLDEGSVVYLCSDVLPLATEMRDLLLTHPCFTTFRPSPCSGGLRSLLSVTSCDSNWLPCNPLPLCSERDQVCEVLARDVYRVLFERNSAPPMSTEEIQHDLDSGLDSEAGMTEVPPRLTQISALQF